jgi:hypothetical protein
MKKSIVILLLALITTLGANAQWLQTSGPEGGSVRALAYHPEGLVASFHQNQLAIYRWDERRWNSLGSLEAYEFHTLGNVLFATTGDGLSRSLDAGTTWQLLSSEFYSIIAIDDSVLYAVGGNSIHRSTDLGESWERFVDLGPDAQTMVFADSTILVGVHGEPGVVRSTNNGTSWQVVSEGLPHGAFPTHLYRHNEAIYAATMRLSPIGALGVYRSTDDGATWSEVNNGFDTINGRYPWINDFYIEGGALAIATPVGTYRLNDDYWIQTVMSAVHEALNHGGDTIFLGTGSGIMTSTDQGNMWSDMNTMLRFADIYDVHSIGSIFLAAGAGGIYRSTDVGVTWAQPLHANIADIVESRGTLLARAQNETAEGVYRSTDLGSTWFYSSNGINAEPNAMRAIAASEDGVFIGLHGLRSSSGVVTWVAGGIYRSTDRGISWTAVNAGLPARDTVAVPVVHLAANGTTIIAATVDGLYRSTDNGDNWAKVETNIGTIIITAVTAHENMFYLAAGGYIYRSTDGSAWEMVENKSPFDIAITEFHSVGDILLASEAQVSNEAETYMLEDSRWIPIRSRLPRNVIPSAMTRSGTKIILGTHGTGVWWGSLGAIAGIDDKDDASSDAINIYPNPATSRASLSFTLTRSTNVELSIYSMEGEQVRQINLGSVAPGTHAIDLDLNGLSPGSYRFELRSGETTQSGTLIVIR